MKLIIAILNDHDTEVVLKSLMEKDFRATRIASTGGFLRRGNTTLLIGLESDRVNSAIELIREACGAPAESSQRRATVFVVDVARFEQL
jgi:uncharacterized protein YaaQ